MCDKAGRKLTALTRLIKILNLQQRRILMKSFIDTIQLLSASLDVLQQDIKFKVKPFTGTGTSYSLPG